MPAGSPEEKRPRRALAWAIQIAWAFFLVTLPLTNFPFFPPAFGGEALVRPLGLYALIALIPLVILPQAARRTLPRTLLPLLAFGLVATASSLLSMARGIDPALGVSVPERTLRGMVTLGLGVAIYLVVALLPQDIKSLRAVLRWIYLGAAIALLWGTMQAVNILFFNPQWFDLLSRLQAFISTRHLFPDRISGMTYEPNWFAEQIILLWLPWLLASVLRDYTVWDWRPSGFSRFPRFLRRLTVEWLLLGWCVLLMPFTFSRAGVLNLLILIILSVVFFRPRKDEAGSPGFRNPERKRGLRWVRGALVTILLIAILAGLIYLVGTQNPFFARIWAYWGQEQVSLTGYLSYLGFDARLIYSQAAANTFRAYPLLGVGLGNYAFYFEEMLPYRPLAEVPEVLKVVTPESGRARLITAKNFYLRLMAETGMLGTITFLSFLIAMLGCALFLWLTPQEEMRFWGSASLIGLIAFMLSTLTFDSFVIPNMWVLFGLITAATRITYNARPG